MCVLLPNTRKDTCPTVSISMYWMSRLKRWPTPLCRRTNRLQYIVVVVSVVKGRCHTEQKGYIIYDLDKGFIGWEEADKEVEK